jgi:hypothetical protein
MTLETTNPHDENNGLGAIRCERCGGPRGWFESAMTKCRPAGSAYPAMFTESDHVGYRHDQRMQIAQPVRLKAATSLTRRWPRSSELAEHNEPLPAFRSIILERPHGSVEQASPAHQSAADVSSKN